MALEEAKEILNVLETLPQDKVIQVRDFVLFLKERYAKDREVDKNDAWTDEDLRDLCISDWKYAEQAVPWKDHG